MEPGKHFRCLERMYLDANCNRYYRPDITIEKGRAVISIEVRDDYFHGAGAVHGSVYFKALDDAAFFAVNSLVKDVLMVTAGFQLYFLRPVAKGRLQADGQVVSAGRIYIAQSRLVDDRGRDIARGSGHFVKSRIALTPEIGYR